MGIIKFIPDNFPTMKSAILALIASVALAADHGFPNDDAFHASCHMTATLTGASCADAKAKADQLIKDNVDTDSEYKGQMSIKDEGDDWIWSKRLTYNKKYTDDQLFEFTTSGSDCNVSARSKSETMSYLDNNVNYCNMWNVISRLDGFSQSSVSASKYGSNKPPSDPVKTCARY